MIEIFQGFKSLFIKVLLFCFLFFSIKNVGFTQTTTFKSGSAIIDMGGGGAPTASNSLKPYGLIYALLNGYNVPVNGIIGQTKVKDGIDFTYGAKSYKGGTYVISSEFLSPDVKTLLNSWAAQGVIIDYINSDLTVNVTYKISFAPKWVMDKTNGNIAVTYLTNAGIPASAYSFKEPSQLGDCDDIFVLPHASPTWNTHNNLYFFNKNKGAIYVSCSAGSALEALYKDTTINGVAQRVQMNFLTTTGLVPASTHKAAVTPFLHQYPTDPIAQYMGITDAAQLKGAEVVYLPKKGGAWNPNTKIITKSPTQPDIPTLSDGPAAVNVYGRGFDDPTRGYVFYEAAHSVNGTTAEFIAAQRMFFNFSFFALGERSKSSFTVTLNNNATPAASTVPAQMRGTITTSGITATVSLPGTYKYEFKSSVPGTFSPSATISSTTLTATTVSFTPTDVNSKTQAVITCVVTDANCTRTAFDSKGTEVIPSMPTLNSAALTYTAKSDCSDNTLTINVFESVVDANAGSRTLTVTSTPSNGSISVNTSTGVITYIPNLNFQGTETLNYTISNGGVSSPASNTITINVGNTSLAPKLTADTYTGILENQLTVLRVLDNDKNNPSSTTNNKLYIRDIISKPAKGYVYINNDGTLTYVSKKNTSSADYTESFTYQACNDQGYCSIATVNVSVIDCGCGVDQYKLGITTAGSGGTLTLTATADAYISGSNASTKYGDNSSLYLTSNKSSSSRKNILLKFDLSSIPSGSTVNSAMMNLYISSSSNLSSNSPLPANIYPVRKNWIEADVTWDKYSSSKNWSNSGATSSGSDYQNITALSLPSPGSSTYNAGTLIQVDLKSFVDSWRNNSYSNYGVVIFPKSSSSSSSTNLILASKENTTAAYRPSLVVNYGSTGTTYNCISIPTNYKPIAYLDIVSTPSNAALTISPLTNDANYYGRTNTVTSVGTPAHGTATISGTSIRYTPSGNFVGTDTLYYTITDQTNSTTSTATIRIDVTRVAPIINRDVTTTPSATNILINVAANDSDAQGALDVPVVTVNPKFGVASINGNSISYTPNTGYVGNDTLVYSRASLVAAGVCSLPLSDTAIVVITMTNRVPSASNDNISATSCKPIEMDLLTNDADPEGTPLTIYIVNNPTHGTISIDEYGKYKYTSSANYVGSDQFTYYVKDGSTDALSSANATVNITVSSATTNNTPLAVNDTDVTVVNQDISTDVIANDSDPDNDGLTVNISASGLQSPAHGTIQLLANGQISYTPVANFTGTDTYQYQVCDNNINCSGTNGNLCAIGTVTISVNALPISISGTIWNDIDKSANNTFSSIQNGNEAGSNAFNSLFAHLVDGSNNVIDQAPIAYDGSYIFTNAPSNASNLKIVINSQLYSLGSIINAGSLPTGFAATTPSITSTFNTTTTNITGQDFGINQLPIANTFTFTEQTNTSPSSLTVNTSKISGTDSDGSIAGYKFTSFPLNVASITINSSTYTSSSWPVGGLLVGTSSLIISVIPNAGTVSPTIKYVSVDNAGFESASEASIILPLYIQLTPGEISLNASSSIGSIEYCGPTIPSQLYSLTNPAGGRGTILYQWEKSTDGSTWTDKVGATLVDYTPTLALDVTTYFRRKSYTSVDNAVYSNTITVTINPLPTVTNSTIGTRIGTGIVSIDATASSDATIDWFAQLNGGTALTTGTLSNTAISYTTPSISTSTIYYAQARDLITSCLALVRTPVLATVEGTLNAGVIGSDQAQCGTEVPQLLETIIEATAGTSTITYQWQSSTNNSSYTNITGATDLTYQPGTISSTTYFRRVATATISGTITSTNSNFITVTVNPLPSLPIAVNKARTGVGTVALSATTGSGVTVDWYDDNIQTNTLATGTNYFTTPELADTTSYFTVARNITTGCSTGTTEVIAIVNENFNGGIIDGPTGICYNTTPVLLTSTSLAHGGTPDLTGSTLGSYSYQWEFSTTSNNAGFTAITGATSATYQPGTLTSTTFFRRKASTANDPSVYSNVLTININALPIVSTISNSSVCAGSGIILTTTGASTYSWSPSAGLSATNIASPTASPSTTTTYKVTGIDINGCSSTSSTTITVHAVPSITLSATSSVNSNATSFNIVYTSTTGSPNKFTITATSPNSLSGFSAISNSNLNSSPIVVTIPASAAGTYNFNISVANSTTGCSSPNLGFTQTIAQAPPSSLSYTSPNVYTTGITINSLSPAITGIVTNYTISPTLPSGLSINSSNGIISGTPNNASLNITYVVTASNSGGSISANLDISVINNSVVQPQGKIEAVDFNLLEQDTVKIKSIITSGVSPYTVIITNDNDNRIDTFTNVLNGDILKLKKVAKKTKYTISKIIDANNTVRSSSFTKDTTYVNILKPNIALTLKAGAAIKLPDNSFKTTLSLKVKNSGDINLSNVQVNANLSEVFPVGINYKLDSVRVVNGNFTINPNYTGSGSATSPSSVRPVNGFTAIAGVKSNAILDANYLFTNGVNLAINEEGQVLYYVSIGATVQPITLKLQFTSSGDAQIVKSDGTISSQNKVALSDDGSNLAAHPNNTNSSVPPSPTYLPLFPIEMIGASLNVVKATPVSGGYKFDFIAKAKNYSNMNLDTVAIFNDFNKSFIKPDTAYIIGIPIVSGNGMFNTHFNGYSDTLLIDSSAKLAIGDSITLSYTLFVGTTKTSGSWSNAIFVSGHSTVDYNYVSDISTEGTNPDPNADGDTKEQGKTYFYVNYTPPLPPLVNNVVYTFGTNYPNSISGLVKSYPINTVPVWCNTITAICQTNAPNTPSIIGKYVYQLKSYDTTTNLYSINYTYDTVTIKPPVPFVHDSTYIIGYKKNPANISGQVIGMNGAVFSYYFNAIKVNSIPTLGSIVGVTNYTVSQVINQIESDTASFKVTMLDPSNMIHLQKLASDAVLQSNSTYNINFTFIVTNLTTLKLDSIIITDNLQNAIFAPSTYSVISTSANGNLVANYNFNGTSDQTVTKYASSLNPLSVDTARFTINFIPYGYSGTLSNAAIVSAHSPYGNININSSSLTKQNETSKNPTPFIIPELNIDIPEGFSPNRDGVNDQFVIVKPYGTTLDLEIFNRWGNVVYANANYNNEWNGKGTNNFLGQDLADGGYYYTLKATDKKGQVQIFKGFVLIQR